MSIKVALVHDYLKEFGGAERVLSAIHELYPRAPVYTSIWDKSKNPLAGARGTLHFPLRAKSILLHSSIQLTQKEKTDWDIRVSALQKIPLISELSKQFTFFMPLVFENFDLREYDVIISDGTIWSKGVLTTPEQLHIFYCHTPPRFLYHYKGETDRRRLWYLQPILKPLDNWLRIWDFESAQRPDYIIANSKATAARIKKFWRREAMVIYPPVYVGAQARGVSAHSFTNASVPSRSARGISPLAEARGSRSLVRDTSPAPALVGDYYLVVSRLSAYKNVDLAIKACNKLKLPLVVVGEGREEGRLRAMAGPTVKLLKFVKDSELSKLYKHCKVLIHPASDEDFGIVPVEAMSFGKPVIALRSGGVTETVVEGKTGIFFEEPTVESLVEVLSHFNTAQYRSEDCIEQASKFSKERFQQQFKSFVEEKWQEFKK